MYRKCDFLYMLAGICIENGIFYACQSAALDSQAIHIFPLASVVLAEYESFFAHDIDQLTTNRPAAIVRVRSQRRAIELSCVTNTKVEPRSCFNSNIN